MKTCRKFVFHGLFSGLVCLAPGLIAAQTQSSNSFADNTAQTAIYQPQPQNNYPINAQTAYDEVEAGSQWETNAASQFRPAGHPKAVVPSRDQLNPSIQDRATRLLNQSRTNLRSNSNSFDASFNENKGGVSYRILRQDNDSSENQATQDEKKEGQTKNDKIDPFADPPAESQDKDKKAQKKQDQNPEQDPFGENQAQQKPEQKPEQQKPGQKPEQKPPVSRSPSTEPQFAPQLTVPPTNPNKKPKSDPSKVVPKSDPAAGITDPAKVDPTQAQPSELTEPQIDPSTKPPGEVAPPPGEIVPENRTEPMVKPDNRISEPANEPIPAIGTPKSQPTPNRIEPGTSPSSVYRPPTSVYRKPPATNPQPSASAQQQPPTTIQPQNSAINQLPTSVYRKPPPIQTQPPATEYQQPANAYAQPANPYMQPANPYAQPSTIYQPPSPIQIPPIVSAEQYVPYPRQPKRFRRNSSKTARSFVPDYQPIPGIVVQPEFVPPSQAPLPPGIEDTSVATSENVYSNVVGSNVVGDACCSDGMPEDGQLTDCQTCDNGCPNFYFSVFGGFNDLRDLNGSSGTRQIFTDNGGGVGIAFGRRNGRNLRTEAEFSYRHNNIDGFVLNPVSPDMPVDGGLNAFAGMANAYWEFTDAPSRCFKPYIGAGIGVVGIDAVIRDSLGTNIVPTGTGSDSSFAYQWMAGINYKAYRNMDLFAEYRFFGADDFRVDPEITGLGDRYNIDSNNVFFGLRWKF